MAKSLLDLARRMDRLAEAIPRQVNELTKEVAWEVLKDLARTTPVDTSAAVSNWIVRRDRPYGGVIGPYFFGEKGSTRTASVGQTINEGRYVIAERKPGQTIYITNNIPYIVDLNEGSSGQAPAGFVQRASAIGRRYVTTFRFKF